MRRPLTTPEGGTPREAGPRALARLPPKAELVIIHLRVTLTPQHVSYTTPREARGCSRINGGVFRHRFEFKI